MADQIIPSELLAKLRVVDTPSVCNAIELAGAGRGFADFTRSTMQASELGSIVGVARTAKIAASDAPNEPLERIRSRRMDYYAGMAEGEMPRVAVIEDLDRVPVGAWWGEVNTTVHKALGVAGALTNGLMRDLGDVPEGFPVIAGGIGPSHAHVHLREVGTPVTIFGLRVEEGDLIHADQHGAVRIPPELIPNLGEALDLMTSSEAIVLEAARAPGFTVEKLKEAWSAMEAHRARA